MNFNKALADAIARGSARASRKPVAALRRDVTELKRQVAELKKLVRDLQKGKVTPARVAAPKPEADGAAAGDTNARVSGPMVRKLRAKLGVTQVEFAKLMGVSPLSVSKWERKEGRIVLRSRTMKAFVRIRTLGKKALKAELEK